MKFEVSIITPLGFLKRINTENRQDFDSYKKEAHDRAVQCLPFDQYPKELTHLVYYYEIMDKDKNTTDVHIYMNPELISDEVLDNFVDTFKPEYVGAIHRRD